MISINKLSVNFTGDFLFKDISFVVGDRERIGLVGKNGAGKSTLLKIIHGLVIPEAGNMVITRGFRTGYLPQELNSIYHKTVWEEVLDTFVEEKKLEKKIEKLTKELTLRNDFSSDSYLAVSQQLADATERFHYLEGDLIAVRVEKVLLGLGFKPSDFHRQMLEFSNGWQMRVELAKILLQKPEIILLDEPTNHLDIESIQWLEEYLINYEGTLILVSHDRAFLDSVTERTIEITFGRIEDYKCSYTEYVNQRLERISSQQADYENQQKEIADIERFIERFRYKSTKAKQVQSRIKMLDKMEKIEVESIDKRSISFRFPPAPHAGRVVVEAQNLTLGYEQLEVLRQIDFSLLRGERVAFVGRNGEGKSTFVKAIVGELAPKVGHVQLGHQVKIGYYAQNQALLLNPEKTVFEIIDEVAVGDIRTQIRTILGKFLFTTEDTTKKVKVLSGGEKSRLALAKLLLSPVNLLILDEPTNHLDMRSKDVLKNALLQYTGSMILVSHDRDFLQGLTEKVVEFKNGTIAVHIGDIYDFLDKRKIATLQEIQKNSSTSMPSKGENKISTNKIEYEERKKQEAQRRKIENQISKIEKEIVQLTKKIEEIEDKLADPELFAKEITSDSLYKEYEELRKEINKKEQMWDKLVEENF
jgi:ATP-binding cassette subfamily F protein 3